MCACARYKSNEIECINYAHYYRYATNADLIHKLMISSDPFITSIRQNKNWKIKESIIDS